jgi:hypothetical protein
MAYPTDEQIRESAYQIWQNFGRPEGRQDEFWHMAEQELVYQADPRRAARPVIPHE